jgi:deoxyribodipyrimidine photo-lyase
LDKVLEKYGTPVTIFWFRRDLRLHDNHGLWKALSQNAPVLPVFIFDPKILSQLPRYDRRVAFIHQTLKGLAADLEKRGSSICILHASPLEAFKTLLRRFVIRAVVANHDYEPYAISRDVEVRELLAGHHIPFQTCKDQVIFEKDEVVRPDGCSYRVFTPYSKEWKKKLWATRLFSYPSEHYTSAFLKIRPLPFPGLKELGFAALKPGVPSIRLEESFLRNYEGTRDFPAIAGTSYASTYLRFGIVSVRHLVKLAVQWSDQWLNELIWREFFMMILFHHPMVVTQNFRRKFDSIEWRNDEREFRLWCAGRTGYPLVDAGMRQLNSTGWMHNRVRMVVASFLTKHLLIDWRWGEAFFAEKLLDYELSSNTGNWQWAAGSGCDAVPYFRIFNPEEQAKKFDPDSQYIHTWIRNFRPGYLPRVVEHEFARRRALDVYKKALQDHFV